MTPLLIALVLTCSPDGKGGTTCSPDKAAAASEADCHHPAQGSTAAPAKGNSTVLTRGEKLSGAESVELLKLLASPTQYEGKTVTVEAKVRKACERKGCWMELAGTDKGPGVRVTFKDYGFFVPVDSAGQTAKVEGVVKVAVLEESRAKHYESEGATVAKGKDGQYREVQLIALGLELRK